MTRRVHRFEPPRADVEELIPTIRRQRQVNFGNTQSTVAAGRMPLLMMSQERSTELELVLEPLRFFIPSASIGEGDWRPYARVNWGHGGIDVSAEFEITGPRQRIPLVGSKVDVSIFIKPVPFAQDDGTQIVAAVPSEAQLTVRGFLADAVDAEPLYPTRWIQQYNLSAGLLVGPSANGSVVPGQQTRLVNLRGWLVGEGGLAYLQLFDQPTVPVNGDLPVDAFPLNASTHDSEVPPFAFGQSRAFAQGLAYAVSSTPFVLTLSAITAFISAELIQ